MNFSTTPNNLVFKTKDKWWNRFSSQPHQLFFSSAIIFAIISMFLTFLSFLGVNNINFSQIHSFGLNYALFTNAFLGFLITVMPKYNASTEIKKEKYLIPWIIFQGGVILTFFNFTTLGKTIVAFIIFYFVAIFYKTIKEGKAIYKKDSIYLNLVFFIGGVVLLVEGVLEVNLSLFTFFGYLISLVFLVAQRMIPGFYSAYMQEKLWEKPKYIRESSTLILLILGICLNFEYMFLTKLFSFVAVVYFGYIIFNLNIYKKSPSIIFILVLGLIWFEIGFIVLFLESIFEAFTLKLALHIFALGFVTTLLIGFGSRVVMGHAVPAQRIVADKITKFLFILIQVVLLSRVISSTIFVFNYSTFQGFLHLTVWLWILLFLIWSLRYGKTLLRINS